MKVVCILSGEKKSQHWLLCNAMDNSWKKPSSFLPWKQISLAKIDLGCCTLPTGLNRQFLEKKRL